MAGLRRARPARSSTGGSTATRSARERSARDRGRRGRRRARRQLFSRGRDRREARSRSGPRGDGAGHGPRDLPVAERGGRARRARRGAPLVLGFTNREAGPILVGKLGWLDLDRLRVWARPLLPSARVRRAISSVRVRPGGGLPADRAPAREPLRRSAAYLNWRYADSPREYALVASRNGFAVVGRSVCAGSCRSSPSSWRRARARRSGCSGAARARVDADLVIARVNRGEGRTPRSGSCRRRGRSASSASARRRRFPSGRTRGGSRSATPTSSAMRAARLRHAEGRPGAPGARRDRPEARARSPRASTSSSCSPTVAVPGALPENCRVHHVRRAARRRSADSRFESALARELRRARPLAVVAHMCPIYAVLAAPLVRPLRRPARALVHALAGAPRRCARRAARDRDRSASTGARSRSTRRSCAPIGHGIDVDEFACARATRPQRAARCSRSGATRRRRASTTSSARAALARASTSDSIAHGADADGSSAGTAPSSSGSRASSAAERARLEARFRAPRSPSCSPRTTCSSTTCARARRQGRLRGGRRVPARARLESRLRRPARRRAALRARRPGGARPTGSPGSRRARRASEARSGRAARARGAQPLGRALGGRRSLVAEAA